MAGSKCNWKSSESESLSVLSDSLRPHGLYSPWNSPGQNTGVGSCSLLQGIFPTQGLNPGLPHCRQILYQLSHRGSPRTLEWAAYPFSSRSFRPKNWTGVSCITGGFFTNWAAREALEEQGGTQEDPKGKNQGPHRWGEEPREVSCLQDALERAFFMLPVPAPQILGKGEVPDIHQDS